MMDTLEQMIIQSSHYTTDAEKNDFLHRTEWAVNFKGLNGLIRTVVSGDANTACELIAGEVFNKETVRLVQDLSSDEDSNRLYEEMRKDSTSIFVVKVKNARKNLFKGTEKWFPMLTRLVIVDNSPESRRSNTSLVFSFHNGIINTLNKAHTKKLGSAANTQLNIRLILESVSTKALQKFHECINEKIAYMESELKQLKTEQFGTDTNFDYNLALYKYDSFTQQLIKDKYSLEKLRDFLYFLENLIDDSTREKQNDELISEFEEGLKKYFYSNIKQVSVATILEGGGRNQIKTYGEYALQKPLRKIKDLIVKKCQTILNVIPDNYERTLHNHFHKNFGINLFLEKYQEFLQKMDNQPDNSGRYKNFLLDLGILGKYESLSEEDKETIREFTTNLTNVDKTSIADDVQMIVRDLLFHKNEKPKPYILFSRDLSWEYKDLFPDDRFDNNPFDLEISNHSDGRLAYDRLLIELKRIKSSLGIFDPSGNLWDRFCENLTIIVNDPSNPTGLSDFNSEDLISFLDFLNKSKITLFLDEAYNDSVKTDDNEEPKWRIISRYVMNNMQKYSTIHIISSISTTKNLGATGNRLGALVSTPSCKDVVTYAKSVNRDIKGKGNSNSLYFLNNTLDVARNAKKIKDNLESNLPKDASRYKIREFLVQITKQLIEENRKGRQTRENENAKIKRMAGFEGSPLHIFILEEMVALDKLDVLGLPDDFKYRGEPFFSYYLDHVIKKLNKFRVNKTFRNETLKRLKAAKEIAKNIIAKNNYENVSIVDSDGSYLFNLLLKKFSSYADLELFAMKMASERGIATLPYKTGVLRFSLGGYIEGDEESFKVFCKDFENAVTVYLKYWNLFAEAREKASNKIDSKVILKEIFAVKNETVFLNKVLEDYDVIKILSHKQLSGVKLNDIRTLYHASPQESGVSVTSIGASKNSVFEFRPLIGSCENIQNFILSRAFSTVYDNLLSQVYKRIPLLKNMNFNTVAAKYSKATIYKYIDNKKTFHPNHFVLDDAEDENIMREILIEMENLLFSDSKMKILAIELQDEDIAFNIKARLEGVNTILRKYIQEILLHFNLPFAKTAVEPSRKEIIYFAAKKFEVITGIKLKELDLKNYTFEFINSLRRNPEFKNINISDRNLGYIIDTISKRILEEKNEVADKLLNLFLLQHDNSFTKLIIDKFKFFQTQIDNATGKEEKLITLNLVENIIPQELNNIFDYIFRKQDLKVAERDIHEVTRRVVLFFIDMINQTRGTNLYEKYTHTLIKVVETEFKKQNSSYNEMVQHGFSLYRNFEMKNRILDEFNNGELKWINDIMRNCGVIGSEQTVQMHTRIVTDAKKREYPFHKIDRTPSKDRKPFEVELAKKDPNYFIKTLDLKPTAEFFINRLKTFAGKLDKDDYRCKISKFGLIKELMIIQKGYLKYLTDYSRLAYYEDISLDDVQNFVPDVILFFGAPEKLISFPQIGYFDIKGPNGSIKTFITPLKKEVDYFGDIKKPRLQMINEKVKEIGGIPKHGSLFVVEEEDGALFGVEIDGDSGGGKSEMIAAMILKWMKLNLPGVRSVKLVAGDMLSHFPR
jgi:hypothetical protein